MYIVFSSFGEPSDDGLGSALETELRKRGLKEPREDDTNEVLEQMQPTAELEGGAWTWIQTARLR
jgi:hypothetical protein